MNLFQKFVTVSLGKWTFVGDADGNYQEDEYNEEGDRKSVV